MICGWTCFIAVMFIISKVYFTLWMKDTKEVRAYKTTLDEDQLTLYTKIVNERKALALQGYGLGLGLSIGYLMGRHLLFKSSTKAKNSFINSSIANICMVVAVTFTVQYFYYILSPKQNWMVTGLKNKEQIEGWQKVYRHFSWHYHLSILIGLIGAGLLGYSFC